MSDDRVSQEDSKNELTVHSQRTAGESLPGTEIPSINIAQDREGDVASEEDRPPPLPPRPKRVEAHRRVSNVVAAGFPASQYPARPRLQATATTALSRTDIHTQSYQDGSRETYAASKQASPPTRSWGGWGSVRHLKIHDGDETASIRSSAPTLGTGGDVESLLGGFLGHDQASSSNILERQLQEAGLEELDDSKDDEVLEDFDREFDEIGAGDEKNMDEEKLLAQWKSKRKHFMILSSAGKPVYTRHGDDNLISGYIGIIQTIISFYEGAQDQLRGFTAGGARFVIMSQGPLYLVAVSKLGESDAQLRVQLEALYMQILSTLALPNLTHLFSNRPSTDLRRPLKGTEPLLSALADTFTRGSIPTLFSALECLKIRKAHREVINNTLLQKRCESLLYGLVVAGGRLVSVVRPRRHSLHPSDLQLIFNMLFEAEGVKAGGGENWIPLCLPGFNKTGYLYMYVSFLDDQDRDSTEGQGSKASRHDEVAVVLISANKESFYDLRNMRDTVVEELEKNGSMSLIKKAIEKGRYAATDIVPGTVLHHFIYKSRANVQFTMPSYEPHFTTLKARRKNALAQSANKVVQWARREEERVFIIGGAVF
ncbi:MAG: hypothetical protein Q9212_001596 [Teloschistes hypoglaucus]